MKCKRRADYIRAQEVALYTSAWIEITIGNYRGDGVIVALYTSAWIEITLGISFFKNAIGRTLHECVD